MTAVLVVVQDGRAWVGADSRVTNSGSYRDDVVKVIERHGWVWSVAGSGAIAADGVRRGRRRGDVDR